MSEIIDLKNIDYVQGLAANIRSTFDTPQGKEVMKFLEKSCGWYDSIFTPDSPELTLINDGKRQVVATLKTLLDVPAGQIVAMAKQKEA